MAKAPEVGLVKTRLQPYLTPSEAATLYECFLADTVAKMRKLERSDHWIAFSPEGKDYFRRVFMKSRLLAQRGRDLGERVHHVFVDLFQMGYKEVVIAGSDSPTMPLASLDQAYHHLRGQESRVVLGPSSDGGYYLVGLTRPAEGLFRNIPWSTEEVLESTMARAKELGLKIVLLPPAFDIDVAKDLMRLWNDLKGSHQLQVQAPKTYAYLRHLLSDKTHASRNKPV
ncbi:MAG: TIGR04282 family arsenosugar biosynthesis glycosyltransferase [Candidatus Binatia bacterium]